jgi:hypothetical protein
VYAADLIEFLRFMERTLSVTPIELGRIRRLAKAGGRDGLDRTLIELLRTLRRNGVRIRKIIRHDWTEHQGEISGSPFGAEAYYPTGNVFAWKDGERYLLVRNKEGRLSRTYDKQNRLFSIDGPGAPKKRSYAAMTR